MTVQQATRARTGNRRDRTVPPTPSRPRGSTWRIPVMGIFGAALVAGLSFAWESVRAKGDWLAAAQPPVLPVTQRDAAPASQSPTTWGARLPLDELTIRAAIDGVPAPAGTGLRP